MPRPCILNQSLRDWDISHSLSITVKGHFFLEAVSIGSPDLCPTEVRLQANSGQAWTLSSGRWLRSKDPHPPWVSQSHCPHQTLPSSVPSPLAPVQIFVYRYIHTRSHIHFFFFFFTYISSSPNQLISALIWEQIFPPGSPAGLGQLSPVPASSFGS